MKKGKYVLIILAIFLVLAIASVMSYIFFEIGRPPVQVPARAYLEINLGGEIPEVAVPDFWYSLFLGGRPIGMYDLWMGFRKAAADARIEAVFLRLGMLECDWAKAKEVRDIITDFRKSGKKVYAYIEEALDSDKEYYLATACDKVILHPLGWLAVNGIGGDFLFFKNALDKLGIKAEFEHVEEYKTAYNIFTESGFTPAHREMMESLYQDIFREYIKTIAAARGKSEDEIKKLIDRGLYQGEKAVEAGLVDDVLYEDEVVNLIQGKERKIPRIGFSDYSRVSAASLGLDRGRRIAIIYGVGTIMGGESLPQVMGGSTVARWIRRARQDKSIAAIVFRVDSPGGSPVASDVIWRETFLAKKEKPFVVSMSDLAGSGGYWVSMSAHKIVAQPQTLTGSIGVLGGKLSLAGLFQKLGVTTERLTFGDKADIFSPAREFTAEEKALYKNEILWSYDKFITKVAEGRNMSKEEVDRVGKGRVWTGNQAKEVKLVDELGGLTKAIGIAKKLAGIPADQDVKLVVWPKKRSFWSTFFGRGEGAFGLKNGGDLEKIISGLKILQKNRVWALMPLGLNAGSF